MTSGLECPRLLGSGKIKLHLTCSWRVGGSEEGKGGGPFFSQGAWRRPSPARNAEKYCSNNPLVLLSVCLLDSRLIKGDLRGLAAR